MAKKLSTADEVKMILGMSERPMTLREINNVLGNQLPTSYINSHISYWIKRGVIKAKIKDGYQKIMEYSLTT